MTTTDNRWTVHAAAVHAGSAIVDAVVTARHRRDHEPALHERVAVLEQKVKELEDNDS